MTNNIPGFIDHEKIYHYLENTKPPERSEVEEILAHARELKGISFEETERLLLVEDDELLEMMFETAGYIKEEIYGSRLVLFAPLYVSNACNNDCLYCGFRVSNKFPRKTLTMDEIRREIEVLVSQGHKRVLLVSGEGLGRSALDYTIEAIKTIYDVKVGKSGEIRRINVNVAAMEVEDYRRLKETGIGTYQLFQETYHYATYKEVHPKGPKSDYLYHLTAMDRAFEAGIDDIGVGILFGLYDYKFEILALLQHIRHLEKHFGMGPHTISVPRLEPAEGAPLSYDPPYPVSDKDFLKIIALLRITVPYTGIILSTRETPEIRRKAFALGVSQISAGSRTNPGGYSEDGATEQFSLGDHRPIDEVIYDISTMGYIPSFCTACYRLGRTGLDFMDLAKPGLIKNHCLPNALTTFKEYLIDYASEKTKEVGERLIVRMLDEIPSEAVRKKTEEFLKRIEKGERDLYF